MQLVQSPSAGYSCFYTLLHGQYLLLQVLVVLLHSLEAIHELPRALATTSLLYPGQALVQFGYLVPL